MIQKIKKKSKTITSVQAWVNCIEVGNKTWFAGIIRRFQISHHFIACFRDISDLKKYQTALIKQKKVVEKLLHSVIPPQVAAVLQNTKDLKSDKR